MLTKMIVTDSVVIRAVSPGEAADLAALCCQIYQQHFTYLWTDEGRWYQDQLYNEPRLKSELTDPNVQYFFAAVANQAVGYLKVKLDSNLDNEPDGLEIERIYLLKKMAGQGVGKQLIERAFDIAQQLNKRYAWLKAMDSSVDSLHFYRKRGFNFAGETSLSYPQMKPEFRRMWQLKKQLR